MQIYELVDAWLQLEVITLLVEARNVRPDLLCYLLLFEVVGDGSFV